jgi:hypothetical protein
VQGFSRREFFGSVARSAGSAAVGWALLENLGIAGELSPIARDRLRFGALDPLVDLLQETPAEAMLPQIVRKLRAGTPLADVVGAASLANARAFGGTNYNGYHTLMAMMPSFEMAARMPEPYGPLPVLKVLYRNATLLQDTGRAEKDALEPLPAGDRSADLVASVRKRDLAQAEQSLAGLESRSAARAHAELQTVIRDDMNVHRVVLAWRAYDLLKLTGEDNALTMLRQSVRFCIDEDDQRARRGQPASGIVALLPELLEEHHLDRRERGARAADDAWIESLAATIYGTDRAQAARATAAALAEGFDPEAVGAAMSLAAARLLLHDPGLTKEAPGKPVGSVHGASIGVHASDAANAWRHLARSGDARNAFASLIAGAYHTAGQSTNLGAHPHDHGGEACTQSDPAELLAAIDGRIRERDQRGACLAARRYCALGHSADDLFGLLLGFAVSEDGALHAEKYFRTAQEEHAAARPAHRWPYLVALTRVMASHFGFPAPGREAARKLLAG